MKNVNPVKMLAAFALVLLVSSVTDGWIIDKCELKAKLDAAQFQQITVMKETITVNSLITRLVCKASSLAFNTSSVKNTRIHNNETKPSQTRPQVPIFGAPHRARRAPPQAPAAAPPNSPPSGAPPSGAPPQATPSQATPQALLFGAPPRARRAPPQAPAGAPPKFPPAGVPPQSPPAGSPPQSPPAEVPPKFPPAGAPPKFPPAGSPPQSPPAGAPPQSPPAGSPPQSPPAGAPPNFPPAGSPPQSPPAGAPPKSPPSGAGLQAASRRGPPHASSSASEPQVPANATAKVVGHLYGVFQLSDQVACNSGMMPSLNICNMTCSALIDEDITDDIACLKTLMNIMKAEPKEIPADVRKKEAKPKEIPANVKKTVEMLVKECHVSPDYFAECV